MRRILIIGGAGYIGSVLTNQLIANGFHVRVLDFLWFNKQTPLIHYSNPRYEFIRGDMTDSSVIEKALDKIDLIVQLAAVIGEPATKKYPELTVKINWEATKKVIDRCREKKINFLFYSTCSNYGISEGMATESSELRPLSPYAETKVQIEKYLIDEVKEIDWFIGRISTAYGLSPRMRFDLTVNEFALKGFRNKYIDIFKPESYRPYLHIFDMSHITMEVIQNFDNFKNDVFNIGFEGENYQKIQIANAVKKLIPETKIEILMSGGDNRDYQVDFSKINKKLKYKNYFNVEKSVEEIVLALRQGLFPNVEDPVYSNTTPDITV